jgi:transcriptional regulator with XRE-family HTH domain
MGTIMPAKAPRTTQAASASLLALGLRIRAQRKTLRVSATVAAQAAGMSRVTLHRIERGEPSVTMGAYVSAMAALGLELGVRIPTGAATPQIVEPDGQVAELPEQIQLADYPRLRRPAWSVRGIDSVTRAEALGLYERNWRHLDPQALEPHEQCLLDALRRMPAHSPRADV